MKEYIARPTARAARRAWNHFTEMAGGTEPAKMWKNPNCWGGATIAGNAWGWWVAEFDRYIPKAFSDSGVHTLMAHPAAIKSELKVRYASSTIREPIGVDRATSTQKE